MPAKPNAAVKPSFTTPPSLTLKRRINAAPEKIYQAWTDPQKITAWFAPPRVTAGTERATIDARVGGRYRLSFDTDNGEHHEVSGVYRDIVPNRRLVFSWAWHSTPERESLVTVSLEPDGQGTMVTLRHEQFFDQAACDNHEGGWKVMLENIERYLA
jgi:uncharacterized protein YndB with AHSA1/START domain